MLAAVIERFGSSQELKLLNLPLPKPKRNELLVRVLAASVNPLDWKIRKGYLPFLLFLKSPLILGSDLSGEIVEVGRGIKRFKTGDKILAQLGIFGGAYAEYTVVPEKYAAHQPENITCIEAAAIPIASTTALLALKHQADVKKGTEVLINGASGGVGTFAVQIAKTLGAKITALTSNRNIDLVKKIGADEVIDYTRQNIYSVKTKFKVIFDTIGNLSFFRSLQLLKQDGIFVSTGFNFFYFISSILTRLFFHKKYVPVFVMSNNKDLEFIADLLKKKQIKPVIDRIYDLKDVKKAHDYSESHRATGKIVLQISTPVR